MRKIEFLLDEEQIACEPILIDRRTETDALVVLEGKELGFMAHRGNGLGAERTDPVVFQRITSVNLRGCSVFFIAKEHIHIKQIKGTIFIMNKEQHKTQLSLIHEFVFRLV